MNENTVIEGKFKANMLFRVLFGIGCASLILGLIYCAIRYNTGEFFYKPSRFGYGLMMPYNFEDSGYTYFSLLVSAIVFEREIGVALLIYVGL